MAQVTRGSSTNEDQIEIDWASLTTNFETGGSPIISYNLQWDSGSSGATFTDLVGFTSHYLGTSFIVTTGVTAGTTYKFKVRAQNAHGWGVFSVVKDVLATTFPEQMNAVTTSIQNSGLNVRIQWVAPYDNSDNID